jgi:hypothetical protein
MKQYEDEADLTVAEKLDLLDVMANSLTEGQYLVKAHDLGLTVEQVVNRLFEEVER